MADREGCRLLEFTLDDAVEILPKRSIAPVEMEISVDWRRGLALPVKIVDRGLHLEEHVAGLDLEVMDEAGGEFPVIRERRSPLDDDWPG